MIIVLSPAKKQDFLTTHPDISTSKPQMLSDIKLLVKELQTYSPLKLKKLMSVSDKLAQLNFERYQDFKPSSFTLSNSKQAAFAFQGDVYQGLMINDFTAKQRAFAQDHLLILSGLYGYLRPLDLIQPYRLEMKTALKNSRGANLYEFWGNKITKAINSALASHKNKLLINLASNEYFKAIQPNDIDGKLINIHFKEYKNGAYKVIGIHAKRARGLMARFIMKNSIDSLARIKKFTDNDYRFNTTLSTDDTLVFTR